MFTVEYFFIAVIRLRKKHALNAQELTSKKQLLTSS